MKHFIPVLFMATLLFGCGKAEKADEQSAQDNENVLTVSQLLEAPDGYVDKEVKLTGTVTHICIHAGKRLHLTDLDIDEKIRVEAGDAIGSFDRDLEGSDIVVTGILREERIDEEYLVEWEEEIRDELKKDNKIEHEGHVEPQGFEAIENTRAELLASGKEYISRWTLDGISFEITSAGEGAAEGAGEDATVDAHAGHGHADGDESPADCAAEGTETPSECASDGADGHNHGDEAKAE